MTARKTTVCISGESVGRNTMTPSNGPTANQSACRADSLFPGTRPMIIGPALTESCLPRTNISHMKVVLQLDHLRFINVRYGWVSRKEAEQHVSEIKLKLQTQSSGVRLWKLYSVRGFIKSCMNMCVLSALSGQSSAVAHLSASLSRR